jgi:hypothetical protein
MYQRKYCRSCQQSHSNRSGFHTTYLARADFVKCNEGERLCKHGASDVFLGQQQGHGDQREQNLRDECERLDTDAGVRRLLRAEVQ